MKKIVYHKSLADLKLIIYMINTFDDHPYFETEINDHGTIISNEIFPNYNKATEYFKELLTCWYKRKSNILDNFDISGVTNILK